MPDSVNFHRVLVTGSRTFTAPNVVRAALVWSQTVRDPTSMLLVHGRCDPRRGDGTVVPWDTARRLPRAEQAALAGADWHVDLAATRRGWQIERHSADWDRHGRRAGPLRNTRMAGLGAAEGHAFLSAGLRNRGTMDCAVKMAGAGIPVLFWCDTCPPVPHRDPCGEHSTRGVAAVWRTTAGAAA